MNTNRDANAGKQERGALHYLTPDRLQIREGGGCIAVFGLPFFAAGLFLLLGAFGLIPISNAGEMAAFTWPILFLMGIAFTAVGGTLAFGRSWTTVDRARRQVVRQYGLLVPMRERAMPLDGYVAVRLRFVPGDSDTADKYPVSLKARTGEDLQLASFTDYAKARVSALAVAEHVGLEFEDASTDHPVRVAVGQLDLSYVERLRFQSDLRVGDARPPHARSEVTRDADAVRIVIPAPRVPVLVLALGLIPLAVPIGMGPSLAAFFRRTSTPDLVGWIFLGFLTLFFGVLPAAMVVNAFLRSRRGATIVTVSAREVRIQERRAWTTQAIATIAVSTIVDVDFSSREATLASARRDAEQMTRSTSPELNPRVERLTTSLMRFARSKGITVKTRTAFFTFGEGLDEAELRYLHGVIRAALLS